MGQDLHRQQPLSSNTNWTLINHNEANPFHHINPFSSHTFYNQQSNQYVEEYQLQFTSEQDQLSYLRELQPRKESSQFDERMENCEIMYRCSPYIYKVKYFVNTSYEDFCSTVYKGLLYIKKVDLRLKQINEIPLHDQLYLLKASLQGFKILYEKSGFFEICEEMIFIDSHGRVKVWLNQNLSKNQPFCLSKTQDTNQSQQLHGSQSQMIVDLFNIIEENTFKEERTHIGFRQYLINKGIFDRLSFYKALEEFDFYCKENRLLVEDRMHSVSQLYQQETHAHKCDQGSNAVVVDRSKDRMFCGSVARSSQRMHQRAYSTEFLRARVATGLSNSNASCKEKSTKRSRFCKQKKSKNNTVFEQQNGDFPLNIEEYPFIPLLPLNKNSQKTSKKVINLQKQISFGNNPKESVSETPKLQKLFTFNEPQVSQSYNPAHQRISSYAIRRNQQQKKYNEVPMVAFNYVNHSQPIKMGEKGNIANIHTFNTIQSQHSSIKQIGLKSRQSNQISYFTPNHSFCLDSEITEDLKKYLGFQADFL